MATSQKSPLPLQANAAYFDKNVFQVAPNRIKGEIKMASRRRRPVWAPWRIEYIRGHKGKGCFLCGKDGGQAAPDGKLVVFRGAKAFVMLNRYPYNSGHLMICPYRHAGDISALSKDELHEIMDLTVVAKNVLQSIMSPDGFNAGFNLGTAAGAGVEDHIHFHLVPRWAGDTNFMPVLADVRVVPEALVETAEIIRKNWKS